jgi:hypothetical protein
VGLEMQMEDMIERDWTSTGWSSMDCAQGAETPFLSQFTRNHGTVTS